MGLFGKKKEPEELLAEGRAQYESGDMKHMFLTLHGLANKGNPEACYYIGFYWLKEKSDNHMAEKYLTIAAKGGQTDAAKLLAERFGVRDFLPQAPESATVPKPVPQAAPKPEPVPEQKLTEAQKREAAEAEQKQQKEEAEHIFNEGVAAYNTKDYAKALSLFEKAAEQGDAAAQCNCGLIYDLGKGTAVDKAKALYWYEKAAEQGNIQAQCNCGWMYDLGEGTAVDKAKALYWFEKAAEQGDAQALFLCGWMYDRDEGTAEDKFMAL